MYVKEKSNKPIIPTSDNTEEKPLKRQKVKKEKVIKTKKLKIKKEKNLPIKIGSTYNHTLLNIISPQGLKFRKASVDISDSNATMAAVTKLPDEVSVGWLSKIANNNGALVSISVEPLKSDNFVSILSKNIAYQRGLQINTHEPLVRQRAERAAENSDKLLKQIDQNNESIVKTAITIGAISELDNYEDDKELNNTSDVYRNIESKVQTVNAHLTKLSFRQEPALQQCMPTFGINNEIQKNYGRITPLRSIVGGFPWATSNFTDDKGFYFGIGLANGNIIMLDPWLRGSDRINSNFVILGKSGSGKSTVIKHILLNEYMNKTKQIIIDPESEYSAICKNLGGDLIKAGGGGHTRINPLQIRPAPKDDDEEYDKLYIEKENGLGDMALHIKNLEIFFSLYLPSLNDLHKACLKICLIEVYKKFNITWDTDISKLKPEDFPTFTDLYQYIDEQLQGKNNISQTDKEQIKIDPTDENFKTLKTLLYDITYGSDSFLWNGHTTLSSDSNFIVLDTFSLQNVSDNVKRAQYFNLLSWCWEQLSHNRDEHCMLYCDEAYLMIDPKVPQSLVFLRNVEKRARKYNAGVAIISHSIIDFIDPSIKMYGQALLDMPCYKVIMGMDGESFGEVKKLYNLTLAEEELILKQAVGVALCFFGSKRVGVNFELKEAHNYQFELMGVKAAK